MPIVTQAEEELLVELDRLVKFYKKKGGKIPKITISKKQYAVLGRIRKKAEKGNLVRMYGELHLSQNTYNGVEFDVKNPLRRNYKISDTKELF